MKQCITVGTSQITSGYHSLDLAKFVGALLVIVIHTSPFAPYSAVANFYFKDVIARIAVPMFFAISGFLFSIKPNLRKNFLRIGKLYLFWSSIYLIIQIPQWYQAGWWGPHVVVDYSIALVTKGTYFHLWYLLAHLIAIPFLYWLLCREKKYLMTMVIVLCWVAECFTYSYAWIGINCIDAVVFFLNRFSGWFDGLFRALPLMVIGVISGRNSKLCSTCYWGWCTLLSFVLLAAEASFLYFCTPNESNYSYLFTTPLFTYFCLCFLLRCDFNFRYKQWTWVLRKCSLMIYCIHPFIDYYVEKSNCPQGILTWLTVTVLATTLSLGYAVISIWRKK